MADSEAVIKLWGKLVTHNKLLPKAKWLKAVDIWKKSGGEKPIFQVLVEEGLMKPDVAAKLKGRVDEVLAEAEKKKAKTPAEKPKKESAPAEPAKSDPPAAAEESGEEEESGTFELDLDNSDLDETDANEIEWSSDLAEETGGADAQEYVTDDDEDDEFAGGIDLVGDDEEYDETDTKVVRDVADWSDEPLKPRDTSSISPPEGSGGGGGGGGGGGTATATAEPATAEDDDERVESPVPPNQVDEQALKILRQSVKLGASDIHLSSGSPPFCRLHGTLTFFKLDELTADRAREMVLGFMDDRQQQQFLQHHDIDFSWEHEDLGRFRVNALEQFRGPSIIFRHVPFEVPTLDELGIPEELGKLTEWTQGLVLVTGPAGSGKTTTASALINLVNENRKDHVITVEDPVEFIHESKGCNVTQRQVPNHTQSFATALKGSLREDPDVIMIGEMRDLETVSLALRAAETGHLVIGTLQTKNAARTIDRIIDVFPSDQQAQIRTMLAESLRGVISQTLIPKADGKGRVAALEVLYVTRAVSNLIRDAKTFQLPSVMQTGRKVGQRLMDDSLAQLLAAGIITEEQALKVCENPDRLKEPPKVGGDDDDE
ncbi:MAG: PilT/PilU family type 4a pilus ATPase [Phycisphaeraceae bacterium]|nr:PilT/PilU family type 4a pilus ATPase [Phycisphaeraceae bacterium]